MYCDHNLYPLMDLQAPSKLHLNKKITFQVNLIVPLFDKCYFFCYNKLLLTPTFVIQSQPCPE